MGNVEGHELVLARGEGSTVWDVDGTEYLDATAGLWFANVGHGREEIADAVAALAGRHWRRITSSAMCAATSFTAQPAQALGTSHAASSHSRHRAAQRLRLRPRRPSHCPHVLAPVLVWHRPLL